MFRLLTLAVSFIAYALCVLRYVFIMCSVGEMAAKATCLSSAVWLVYIYRPHIADIQDFISIFFDPVQQYKISIEPILVCSGVHVTFLVMFFVPTATILLLGYPFDVHGLFRHNDGIGFILLSSMCFARTLV